MLIESFGSEATLEAVEKLHLECDDYGTRILKRFVEARNVKRIVQDIDLHRKRDMGDTAASPSLETCLAVQAWLLGRRWLRRWTLEVLRAYSWKSLHSSDVVRNIQNSSPEK